jgi:hypothetical protein
VRAKGSCLGRSQFLSAIYTYAISDFHLSPRPDNLCSRNLFTTIFTDARGLHFQLSSSSKRYYKGEGDKGAGRSRVIGLKYRNKIRIRR